MNSIHNNGPDDKLLNDELEKLAQAYQQVPPEEPPELLDQAILNKARRAVEKRDYWLDFGWIKGLTTAAVVVLAVSVILTQRQPVSLEDNILAPTDAPETELIGKLREPRHNVADDQQEESKELSNELRKDMSQTIPAASTPETQAGSRTQTLAARKPQREMRAKKSLQSERSVLEEDLMRENTPVEAEIVKSAAVGFADEPPLVGAGALAIDLLKADSDKISQEKSLSSSEEEQLQAILVLKRAGDNSWKAGLETFIENHPDYPLPDELKN